MTAKENTVPPYVNTGETIGYPPPGEEVEGVVRRIAGNILHHTKRAFVDAKSGTIHTDLSYLPADESITLADPYCDWKYWNGVIYIGMKRLGEELHEQDYITYGARNFTFIFNHLDFFKKLFEKRIPAAPLHQYFRMDRLDDCGAMGAALLETLHGDTKKDWQQRIGQTADYIMNKQDRLADGTFARRRFGKTTLWADDLYMSVPFLAGMYSYSGNDEYLREATRQVLNFHERLFEPFRGLYYHTWYSEEETFGVAFWGRANGWAAMAKCHLLEVLPAEDPSRMLVLKTLREQITGFARYQGADGMWKQLPDKTDSWSESSCTAMFTYAVAKAVNEGWIDNMYSAVAVQGWDGLTTNISAAGVLNNVSTGFNIKQDLPFYYNRPVEAGGAHGLGAVLLAGTEMLKLKKFRDCVWC